MNQVTYDSSNPTIQPTGIGCMLACGAISGGCSALFCTGDPGGKIGFAVIAAGSGAFAGVTALVAP